MNQTTTPYEKNEYDRTLDERAMSAPTYEVKSRNGRVLLKSVKCGLCRRLRPFGYVFLFSRTLQVPFCTRCVLHSSFEKWAESVVVRRASKEPPPAEGWKLKPPELVAP